MFACLQQRTILGVGDDEEHPGSVGTESSSSTMWQLTTLISPTGGTIQSLCFSLLNVLEEVKVMPTPFFFSFWNDACDVKL